MIKKCPNCGELKKHCACMRNTCVECGKPVGNITFTICDNCWDKKYHIVEILNANNNSQP